jgi:hypothetical protein
MALGSYLRLILKASLAYLWNIAIHEKARLGELDGRRNGRASFSHFAVCARRKYPAGLWRVIYRQRDGRERLARMVSVRELLGHYPVRDRRDYPAVLASAVSCKRIGHGTGWLGGASVGIAHY